MSKTQSLNRGECIKELRKDRIKVVPFLIILFIAVGDALDEGVSTINIEAPLP